MRIVDVVALALVLLCGLCAAYNSMDLAELLRGRQRLAEQKRAMDGTSFPLHFLLLHFQMAPVQSMKGNCEHVQTIIFILFFQCLFLLVIENFLKNKISKRNKDYQTKWPIYRIFITKPSLGNFILFQWK